MIEKFCINCTHAVTHSPILYCSKSSYLDLVTGDVKNVSCNMARELERYCGQRAIHFQPSRPDDVSPHTLVLDQPPF